MHEPDPKPIDWSSVDWSLPSRQIADILDVMTSVVTAARRRLAPHTLRSTKSRSIDWSAVDWRRPTSEIAASLGVEVAAVSLARGRLAPETLRPYTRRRTGADKALEAFGAIDTSGALDLPGVPEAVATLRRLLRVSDGGA